MGHKKRKKLGEKGRKKGKSDQKRIKNRAARRKLCNYV